MANITVKYLGVTTVMAQSGQKVAASAAGARGGPGNRTPALKAKEVVKVERTPEGVKIIRKIVMVDAETEKFVRELCLPCDEEWYSEIYGDDPDCVCEKYIGTVDEIILPPDVAERL